MCNYTATIQFLSGRGIFLPGDGLRLGRDSNLGPFDPQAEPVTTAPLNRFRVKHFRHQKNIFWGSRKSFWGPKRPISESYELNLAI